MIYIIKHIMLLSLMYDFSLYIYISLPPTITPLPPTTIPLPPTTTPLPLLHPYPYNYTPISYYTTTYYPYLLLLHPYPYYYTPTSYYTLPPTTPLPLPYIRLSEVPVEMFQQAMYSRPPSV